MEKWLIIFSTKHPQKGETFFEIHIICVPFKIFHAKYENLFHLQIATIVW